MANRKISPERARERTLFQYHSALERVDFETVAAVLKQAERDPILWQMIDDLAAFDEGTPEPRLEKASRAPRNDKYISQIITVHDPASNGQTPKPDHSQEDTDMMFNTTFESTVPGNPKTLYPFVVRFITLAAAILIVTLVGGILIQMGNHNPLIGYPGAALQTEVPKPCTAENITDTTAESQRLAEAATKLLVPRVKVPEAEVIEQSALLALCAMRMAQTPEADSALQLAMVSLGVVPTFPGQGNEYNAAIFSPDGSKLLIASADGVHLWDIATHSEVRRFPGDAPVSTHQAVFSPDGRYILGITADGRRLWDTETGATVVNDYVTGKVGFTLAYSPDGVHAAFGMVDGTVQLWNVNPPTLEQTFQVHHSEVGLLAFSPDGKALLVSGSLNPFDVYLVNLETGEQRAFSGLKDFSNGVAFSPDGKYVLAGADTDDRTAILWDTETGEQVHQFSGFTNDINVVTFSPDGQYVLLGSADKSARIFNVQSGAQVRKFDRNSGYVESVSFSPDGKTLLIGSYFSDVRLWPVSIDDTVALACSKLTRDFTADERTQYGLGEGAACP